MRKSSVLAALLLAVAPAAAPADITTKDVTLTSGKDEVKAFLAVPEGKGPFPGVVVIQEWWGLNDWMKDQAKRLAKQGYVALVPDLYRGKVATEPAQAQKLMKGMPQDRALRDLKAATDYLAKHDSVNKDKLGTIGWCMGGGLALRASLADNRLVACGICYGRVITDKEQLEPLKAEVLGVFGKEDKGIPVKDVKAFEEALKEAGKKAEIHFYDAGHAFMRESKDNKAHKEKETKAAYEAIDKFFARTLKGK